MISIERHSPSSLNRFASSPAMYVLERVLGLKQPVGPQAHRGTAVEGGVAYGLQYPDATIEACTDMALTCYDTLTAMSPDGRREKVRDGIPDMVRLAVDELRPYGKPSKTQGFIEWRPDGLKLPIVGFYDFFWEDKGIVIDLKTTDKMPSAITIPHAMQVAFYAMSDNMDARLTYVTPKKCETYQLENIREHREALLQMALRVERFLALSDDPEYFLGITVPDLGHYLWNNPSARQLAWEHWRI